MNALLAQACACVFVCRHGTHVHVPVNEPIRRSDVALQTIVGSHYAVDTGLGMHIVQQGCPVQPFQLSCFALDWMSSQHLSLAHMVAISLD